jgi:two-component system, NtrC family, response regulator AtoC
MSRPRVLIVDDDESVRSYLAVLLSGRGYAVVGAGSGEEALTRLGSAPLPALVLLDLLMPGLSGLELLARIRKSHPHLPIIVLSTMSQIKTVVDAVKCGASDYLAKPFGDQELELAIQNALEKQTLREEIHVLQRQLDRYNGPGDLILSSSSMARIRETARQVADTDAPVLILGESGVGKEVVSRFIHAYSCRRDQRFVKVNCAALPEDLLESELFGYERGAFSGAVRDKPGKFELADRGSILLDEIGEMSPNLQAKLLHVLQDGEFSRLGGSSVVRVDARILSSTNARLDAAVASGHFREDLYFRLNVIRIEIPPLRERPEDVAILARHFFELYSVRYRSALAALPPALLEAFQRYEWPGNVRELENAVRRYVILPDVDAAVAQLRRSSREPPAVGWAGVERRGRRRDKDAPRSLKQAASAAAGEVERRLIQQTLVETRWNRREAARRLNMSYKALLNRLKRWETDAGASLPASGNEV